MPGAEFAFSCYVDHPDLHSFPTRRSSDLAFLHVVFSAQTQRRQVSLVATSSDDRNAGRFRARIVSSGDRKSTRLNSSHVEISYAVSCSKKKTGRQPLVLPRTRPDHAVRTR